MHPIKCANDFVKIFYHAARIYHRLKKNNPAVKTASPQPSEQQ